MRRFVFEAFLAYLFGTFLVWAFQRRLLYPGRGHADVRPEGDARLVIYVAEDGTPVHALEVGSPDAARTVVYFHGNGEVAGDNLYLARELARHGLAVSLVEYRGFGHSAPGEPTEKGLYADAEAVVRGLAKRGVDPSRIVLWGASLGTGVATEMAARGYGSALILVSPYTSMSDVASSHMPWFPVSLLLKDRFDNQSRASRIRVPTLVLHGTKDEVVPFRMGKTLAGAIAGARFVGVEGGHHNDLLVGAREVLVGQLADFALAPR